MANNTSSTDNSKADKKTGDEVTNPKFSQFDAPQVGSLPLKASDLLKAAKDKSDYELKVKDQQLAFMEMVYYFASGGK